MSRTSAICYFCKGANKDFDKGKIVRTKDGGKAFKCEDCIKFDEEYEK